jgi:hypothetical protein
LWRIQENQTKCVCFAFGTSNGSRIKRTPSGLRFTSGPPKLIFGGKESSLALEQRFEDRKEWDQKAPLFLIHGHPLSKQRSSGMLKLITEKLGWNPKVYESILRRTGFAHKLFLSKRRCFFNSIEGTTDCLEDHRSLEIGCVQVRPFFHYNTLLSCIISLHRNASRGRAHYVTIPEGNIASLAAAWVPQGPGEEAVGWAEVAGAQGTFLIIEFRKIQSLKTIRNSW